MAGNFSWHNIPVVGGLFENPNEKAKLDAMRRAGQVYQAQRPVIGQARMNALANTMAAFAPVANAAALMYGPAGTPNTQMMLRNPYTGQAPPLEGGPAAAAPAPPPQRPGVSPGTLAGMSHGGRTYRPDGFSSALDAVMAKGGLGISSSQPLPPPGGFSSTVRNSNQDPRSAEAHDRQAGSMGAVNRATRNADAERARRAALNENRGRDMTDFYT